MGAIGSPSILVLGVMSVCLMTVQHAAHSMAEMGSLVSQGSH